MGIPQEVGAGRHCPPRPGVVPRRQTFQEQLHHVLVNHGQSPVHPERRDRSPDADAERPFRKTVRRDVLPDRPPLDAQDLHDLRDAEPPPRRVFPGPIAVPAIFLPRDERGGVCRRSLSCGTPACRRCGPGRVSWAASAEPDAGRPDRGVQSSTVIGQPLRERLRAGKTMVSSATW